MFRIILLILAISISGQTLGQTKKVSKKDLKKLYKIMKGQFSSEAQSKKDSTYFNIKLTMTPIWKKDNDGYWLYVEQAVSTTVNKPYRQRVYHLYVKDDYTIVSKVYEIKDPSRFVNASEDSPTLYSLTKEMLIDRQGCSIYLSKKDNIYMGSTPGKECLSTLRGASYATSEVSIFNDRIISWDRGWDLNDKQVWGAEKGGYFFIKQK
jgi:hypothetical protein